MAFVKQIPGVKQEFDEKKILRMMKSIQTSSEEEKTAILAGKLGFPYLDLNIFPIPTEALHTVKEEFAKKAGIVVFNKAGSNIKIAIAHPENLETVNGIIELQKQGYRPQVYLVSDSGLEHALEKYKLFDLSKSLEELKVSLSGQDLEMFEKEIKELVDLKRKIAHIPTTEVLKIVIAGGIKMDASDIHFEPQKEAVRLRYRIDGVLQEISDIPYKIYSYILSRVKMMAGMKLNIKDKAQDGRFEISIANPPKDIDVRVSILPGNYGENIVARILSQDMTKVELEGLGLEGAAFDQLTSQITKPNGMILNTGPTGSGKTTTLYACLKRVNDPTSKIITIEDPIEYKLAGISQTQVEKERGYDFASGLRAIVRQDPDVVLVGEIRDEETADIATHAALTGHLVFSTVHANSSTGAIPRLYDLGVRPSLISSSLNAVIAQRLVRKLCPHCKEEYEPASVTLESINKFLSIISPKANIEIPKNVKTLYRAKGCVKCRNIGYKGRLGIFEVFILTSEIEKMINDMASDTELMTAAIEDGMITMLQDGLLKAVAGDTSMEEVQRVTGSGEFLEQVYEKVMNQLLNQQLKISKDQIDQILGSNYDREKVKSIINNASNQEALEYIFASAIYFDAGDIHLEPVGDEVQIRFRINGILENIMAIDKNVYLQALTRVKNLSGFKSTSHEAVRDSRFGIQVEEPFGKLDSTELDIRVSIITSGYGETVVMRLLNKSAQSLHLTKIGFRGLTLERLKEEIQKPNGIILNTGPTGSGKTTTLYSILNKLNRPEVKIITVEDPIEYRMKGVLQTQVNEKDGYTFSNALRALMRQNPDILMIGEIRDEETAKIAIQASLTGHLVLSTLHTNNAVASIQRLINMNVDPSDIASATNVLMAQRLVRKLCDDCKKPMSLDEETISKIKKVLAEISPNSGVDIPDGQVTIYEPAGCPKCKGTGYVGVIPVAEVMQMSEALEDLISRFSTVTAIEKQAIQDGMLTMAQDGILKVLEGVTSLSEVQRVTEE
jgi:type IV pilus assembly protein PilB